MIDKQISKRRGRPRAFDRDEALGKAQALFHAHGYEGVGVAALAEAMGTAIEFVEDIPALDDTEADYSNAFDTGDEDGAGVSDFELDQLAQFFEDKEAIKSVPDNILDEMLSLSALGILRDELKTALLKERERRKSRR